MGAGHTKIIKVNGHTKGNRSIARWRNRDLPTHFFAVVRHAERADSLYSLYNGGRWTASEDFQCWPVDTPLSDSGMEAAAEIGAQVSDYTSNSAVPVHTVVSSPYFRCVQTAVEICRKLQGKVRLILDRSLGELYGPDIMGDFQPVSPTRPMPEILAYCKKYGVNVCQKVIGKWPTWPEDLRSARKRFGGRFLTYLHRSNTARRNFIIVTHADGVGAALSLMPSTMGQVIESVDYGGYFLAERQVKANSNASSSSNSSSWKWGKSSKSSSSAHQTPSQQQFAAVIPMGEDFSAEEPGCDASPESGDDACVTSARTHQSQPSMLAWAEKPDDHDESCADGTEISSPKVPKASDGWKVTTSNIKVTGKKRKTEKTGISSAARKMLTKRLQNLAGDSNMSHEHMERLLLGSLSDKPLGIGASDSKLDVPAQTASGRSETQASMSTYIFGASEVGSVWDLNSEPGSRVGSRVCSEAVLDEDCIQAVQPTGCPAEFPQRALTMQTHHEKLAGTHTRRSSSRATRAMMMTVDPPSEIPKSRSITIGGIGDLQAPQVSQSLDIPYEEGSPRTSVSHRSHFTRHPQSARSFKKASTLRDDSDLGSPGRQNSVGGFVTIQEMPLPCCAEDSENAGQPESHAMCENSTEGPKAPAVLQGFENSSLLQRRALRTQQNTLS